MMLLLPEGQAEPDNDQQEALQSKLWGGQRHHVGHYLRETQTNNIFQIKKQTEPTQSKSVLQLNSQLFFHMEKMLCADLLQHGHVSDSPPLEGRPSVALNLDELILLSLRSLNVGHLQAQADTPS